MPSIVQVGNPIGQVLAGLNQSAGEAADAINARRQLDAYLQDAAQRLALMQSRDTREADSYAWEQQRRGVQADQNDALARARIAGQQQENELGRLQLDSYKSGASNQQGMADAILSDYDTEVARQMHGLEGDGVDPAALAKVQQNVATRRAIIQNAGQGEVDPKKRAAAQAWVASLVLNPLRGELDPLVREQVRARLTQAQSRGLLSANGSADAKIQGMLQRLDTPGTDPRELRSEYDSLQKSISDDLEYQGAMDAALQDGSQFEGALSFEDRLAKIGLESKLRTGAITPREYSRQIRSMLSGSRSPAGGRSEKSVQERALGFAIEYAKGQNLTLPEVMQIASTFGEHLQSGEPRVDERQNGLPFSLGPEPTIIGTKTPGSSAIASEAPRPNAAAGEPDQGSAGPQPAASGAPEARIAELYRSGNREEAMRLAAEQDPEAQQFLNPDEGSVLEPSRWAQIQKDADATKAKVQGWVAEDKAARAKAAEAKAAGDKGLAALRARGEPKMRAPIVEKIDELRSLVGSASQAQEYEQKAEAGGAKKATKGLGASRLADVQRVNKELDELISQYEKVHGTLPPDLRSMVNAVRGGG